MISLRYGFALSLGLTLSVLLAGCGVGISDPISLNQPSSAIRGTSIGGQNPITGATISVYAFGTGGYGSAATLLASTTTDDVGAFNFSPGAYTCPQSNTPVYLLSIGGNSGSGENANAVLGSVLGSCTHAKSTYLIINEVSTVGLAYALAHFFNPTLGGTAPANDSFGGPSTVSGATTTYSSGLVEGNSYTANILAQYDGTATPSSNTMTTELTKVYTIANILAACVNSKGQTSTTDTSSLCGRLFNFTTPPGATTRPSDTLQAAVVMALYPTQYVNNLFLIPSSRVPFPNDLTSAPADWSLAVSYTAAGLGLGVDTNTLSTLDIDTSGRVWFPSTAAGGTGVAYFDPASSSFYGPFNSTAMVHPNQVAIDGNGFAWLSDTQSSLVSGYNTAATGNYSSLTLANTHSLSLSVGQDTRLDIGLYDSGTSKYKLANVSTDRLTYAEQTTSLLTGFAPVSLASDASNDLFLALSSPTTTSEHHYYLASGSTTPAARDTASDATGQTAFNGADLIGTRSYVSTGAGAVDGICFNLDDFCYSIKGSSHHTVTGVAVDGAKTIWLASGADGTVQAAPMTTTGGTGLAASYTVTVGSAQQIATNVLTHNSSNGNTLIAPAGLAIDRSGNVWVSNAGCNTTGCTPGSLVLSEIIGAAAPTITPVSGQITAGNLAGTEPTN